MRKCSICSHTESAAINKAIVRRDGTFRAIAERYGLTHTSVKRHHDGCLALKPKREPKASPAERLAGTGALVSVPDAERNEIQGKIPGRNELLAELAKIFQGNDLLAVAIQKRNVDEVCKLGRTICAAAESYAKIAGLIVVGANVVDNSRHLSIGEGLSKEELRAAIRALSMSVADTPSTLIDGNAKVTTIEALPAATEGTE